MTPIQTRISRPALALLAAIGLSACASIPPDDTGFDATSRAAPVDQSVTEPIEADNEFYGDFKVLSVNVNVPDTLTVSEANSYYPGGDIVWREDPIGNRHEQVKAVVVSGLQKGVNQLEGEQEVILDVVVSRFHALTEKARYTTGGVHAIQFTMRLRDPVTNEIIAQPKFIKADFDALGGRAAIQAEAKGVTQRSRITDHLAFVILEEFSQPDGFVEYDNGLLGALNQL